MAKPSGAQFTTVLQRPSQTVDKSTRQWNRQWNRQWKRQWNRQWNKRYRVQELVHEDRSHLGMEMWHLWYISYTLHIIVLWGHTIQRGQSYQLHSYSKTVGSDWSGCAHLYKYVLARSILRPVVFAFRTSRTYERCACPSRGSRVLMGPVRSAPFIQWNSRIRLEWPVLAGTQNKTNELWLLRNLGNNFEFKVKVQIHYILTIYMPCNTMYADIYKKRGMLSPLSWYSWT
jgi:hypothetical protein